MKHGDLVSMYSLMFVIRPDLVSAVVIRILELMHEALRTDVVISKRLLSSCNSDLPKLTLIGTFTTATLPCLAVKSTSIATSMTLPSRLASPEHL